MKKRLLVALSLAVILSLASFGCSGGSNPPASADNQTTISTTSPLVTTTSSAALNMTLTIIVEGGGQVIPAAGKYSYPKGTVVNLTAIGDVHWTFNLWLGSVADTHAASTSVIMNSDQTITAYFSATMD